MLSRLSVLISCALVFCSIPAGSITSGWPAIEREFPSAVLIWTIEEHNKPKYLCTGVMIAPDTVATAASCVYTETHVPKADTLFISTALKINFKEPLSQTIQGVSAIAKKGVRHHEADLMLIFLNQPLSVEPAMILSSSETFQIRLLQQVILAGYGLPNVPQEPSRLNQILGRTEKEVEWGEKLVAKSKIVSVSGKDLLIAKIPEDGTACSGDQGAPVFAHIDTPYDNSQRVLGLIAHSSQLAKCAQPSTAIRLDAYREFLNEKMTLACKKKERVWCKIEGLQEPRYSDEIEIVGQQPIEDTENPPKIESPESNPSKPKDDAPSSPLAPFEPHKETQSLKPPSAKTPVQPAPKPAKRRLTVSAEGAGCSCQQVFTASR